jgi:hypothetical protein
LTGNTVNFEGEQMSIIQKLAGLFEIRIKGAYFLNKYEEL